MSESEEKYLKTVFVLAQNQGEVSSVDIASELGHSRASVCRAMKILKENGYIAMEYCGKINLTQVGFITAKSILDREAIISEFFHHTLSLNNELSAKYSAHMARIIDQDTLNKMRLGIMTVV